MKPQVSSPQATGGAGTFFEQHVDTYWLAQLLVRGIPPILLDCTIEEVHFQTERQGWNTDDFLIIGERASGYRKRLAGQVKRSFTISTKDEECRKTIQDFWKDFNNKQLFDSSVDRLALVTLRGTNVLLEHFSGLLDGARAARNGNEFELRLNTPGLISSKAIRYCDEIRSIVGDIEGTSVSTSDVWSFLRVLHILSLDLNSATSQTEAVIKSLLAYTSKEQDPVGSAEASWNTLLREVSLGMPDSRSFGWKELPEALRLRHSPVAGAERLALSALNDHSSFILDGIRSTIGDDLHLSRVRLVQQVIEQLESTQVVVISGSSGSGKSGIAKDVIKSLASEYFAFGFRAEEFAHPHFDESLQSVRIPANATMLGAILAGQARKVMLVESVERLLETSTRDAFSDLLTLVMRDKSWRLILTCRDYSVELVRSCFLESTTIANSVVNVLPMDDEELEMVEVAYPPLARPLGDETLRRLLRNPFVLDKALKVEWSEARPLPQSERDFRALFWRDIIRVDHYTKAGMPSRREDVFVKIALRRARALTLFSPGHDLDAEVIDKLKHESLIVSSRESHSLIAPAHDVLEDWAILQWIDEKYLEHQGSFRDLSDTLGTYPAIRRTYRKWLDELSNRNPAAADELYSGVMHDSKLPARFRDDTLVSLLRSSSSAPLLERQSAELFANDKHHLRRIIHLLRVACVKFPDELPESHASSSLLNMPDGQSWACVLRLVSDKLGLFSIEERFLLLGLIEDWSRSINWGNPYPEGFKSVAIIAHWLLASFADYRSNDHRKQTLRVLAKIPYGDRERFAYLLTGGEEVGERNRTVEDFRKIILEGMEGNPAARDMPDLVISIARDFLLCSEEEVRREGRWFGERLDTEISYGIKQARNHGYFPASAYRGPFLALLRHHSQVGLEFIKTVLNHSADWYFSPRVKSAYVIPDFEILLKFEDGTSRSQRCDVELWNLYRGLSSGPYVLKSLLMALERWLLEIAEAYPLELDAVLLQILRDNDASAVTAVVASVSTAFPHSCSETLLVLLRSPECIMLDRCRVSPDLMNFTRLKGLGFDLKTIDGIYYAERRDADARPHRRQDLEMAIANLQLGPLAPRIYEILDHHRRELPPLDEQDEEDRIWRLALHRMDLRQYTVTEEVATSSVPPEIRSQEAPNENRQYLLLDLKLPEPDLKEMSDQSAARFQSMNARLGLLMWGRKVFDREEDLTYDPDEWRQRLQEARIAAECASSNDDHQTSRGGPGFVAAICARDHWVEMDDDERTWCLNVICTEVTREGDLWSPLARVQSGGMSADRPCATVIPLLMGKLLNEDLRLKVFQVLVIALTHAIDEVRWQAALGIGRSLWSVDRDLTMRCVNALAFEAALVQQVVDEERKRPYNDRIQIDRIEATIASDIRRRFFEVDGIPDDALHSFDPTRGFGAQSSATILAVLGQATSEPASISAFLQLSRTLIAWWDADDDQQHRNERQKERNHGTEFTLTNLLQNFVHRTSLDAATSILQPILDSVDCHPREVHQILLGLISVEDRHPNTFHFWSLWKLFADKVKTAKWLHAIDYNYGQGKEMVSAIFLGSSWKNGIPRWDSLEGHAYLVNSLFEELPPSSTILENYVRFLFHFGDQSLPEAFIRISKNLYRGEVMDLLKKRNTVYLLEVLLQRYVYGRPLELKRRHELRDSVLVLLDLLVEAGSSSAFRMRDDFVTPISLGVSL